MEVYESQNVVRELFYQDRASLWYASDTPDWCGT